LIIRPLGEQFVSNDQSNKNRTTNPKRVAAEMIDHYPFRPTHVFEDVGHIPVSQLA
jgi:hypothetical protein